MIDIETTSLRFRTVWFFLPALFGEMFIPNLLSFVEGHQRCGPDDGRIVSHDAILYLHDATSKLSWIQREKTWFSPQSISCFYRSKREEKCII